MKQKLSFLITKQMLVLMLLMLCYINSNTAQSCTDCSNITLGTESKNITYGPSNEFNCRCDWTIPKSLSTDDETAVVLLLQNVSLTMTSATTVTDCFGTMRFPGTSEYKCKFPFYCLAFATGSSNCNINKIREKIQVTNHTCDEITPWNKAGGGPYRIQYFAKNLAGHIKYFLLKYLVISCLNQTNTFDSKTTLYTEGIIGTTRSTSFQDPTMDNKNYSTKSDAYTTASSSSGATNNQQGSISTTTIIIIAGSAAVGLIIVLVVAVLMKIHHARNNKDTPKNKVNADGTELNPSSEKEIVNNPIYDTSNSQQGLEIIVNGIYELPPDAYNDIDKTMDVGEPCLYAVVQKQEENKKEVVGDSEEDIVVTIEDEPASVYAVVNKDKK